VVVVDELDSAADTAPFLLPVDAPADGLINLIAELLALTRRETASAGGHGAKLARSSEVMPLEGKADSGFHSERGSARD
jgi:hypothetical protein